MAPGRRSRRRGDPAPSPAPGRRTPRCARPRVGPVFPSARRPCRHPVQYRLPGHCDRV